MERELAELKTVMQSEIAEYKKMLALAAEKKDILFKNDAKALDEIVGREWTVLGRIKKLEATREALISRVAQLCGKPEETLSLKDIIGMVSGEIKEEFKRIREELTAVVSELKINNAVSKGLLETQLQYTRFCMSLLSGELNAMGTYSHSGEISENSGSGTLLIDQSV